MCWVRTLVVVCAITSVTAGSGCFLFPSPRVVAERTTELTNSPSPESSANTGRVLLHTRLIEQAFRLGERGLTDLLRSKILEHDAESAQRQERVAVGLAHARINQALGVMP